MANSTQPEKQDFEMVEINESVASAAVRDLKTELLHHLVNVSSQISSVAQQNNSGNAAAEELIKKNAGLVSELLKSSIVPMATNPAQAGVWKEVLMQKLPDGKVNLADETVKELVNRKAEEEAKNIDEIIDRFVNFSVGLKCFENTVRFTVEPNKTSEIYKSEHVFVQELDFNCVLDPALMDFHVHCNGLSADKNCKATIKVTIKNQAGGPDFVRSFKKAFTGVRKAANSSTDLYNEEINQGVQRLLVFYLIGKSEFEDESLGLMKDGKMNFEVFIRVDELTDKPKNTTPTATTAKTTIS